MGPWAGPTVPFNQPSVAEIGIELNGQAHTLTVYDRNTRIVSYPPQPVVGGQEIPIEIVSMSLTGFDPILGPVQVRQSANPALRSLGCVMQVGGAPWDSFFDVFVDITLPSMGTSYLNQQPVPVDEAISNIPPYGEPFTFKGGGSGGGDRGVRLHENIAGFPVVGNINLVKHVLEPPQNPSWTIDDVGPNARTPLAPFAPYHPSDILTVPGAPIIGISCAGLGLATVAAGCDAAGADDNVDALAYGDDFTSVGAPVGYVGFSVRPGSLGMPATAVSGEASCLPPEPETDEFGTVLNGTNYQIFDGNGTVCDGNFGPPIQPANSEPAAGADDDLDGIDNEPPSYVTCNDVDIFDPITACAHPDFPVYFSLTPGSPTLLPIGATEADVLSNGPVAGGLPTAPSVYRSEAAMGLAPGGPLGDDDIDGICVRDAARDETFAVGTDILVYSLAAGSASLGNGNIRNWALAPVAASPADLIMDFFGTPIVLDEEFTLGLLGSDDVDAMKCVKALAEITADQTVSQIIDPVGAPFQTTTIGHIVNQVIGTTETYNVSERKLYPLQPQTPSDLVTQFSWTACRLSAGVCVVADADVNVSWLWSDGDQCTLDQGPIICPVLIPAVPTNDLHFNERVIQNVPNDYVRDFRVTCNTAGSYQMRVDLNQRPFGADAVRSNDDNLRFEWQLNCNAPPPDTDGDGWSDDCENAQTPPSNPNDASSTPNKGLTNPAGVATAADADADHIIDVCELSTAANTNPANPDTDGDGVQDGIEVGAGTNPLLNTGNYALVGDVDGDGCTNLKEINAADNPIGGAQENPGSDRHPGGWWDMFSVDKNSTVAYDPNNNVDLSDTIDILAHFGQPYGGGAYPGAFGMASGQGYDRTRLVSPGPPGLLVEGNNGIDLTEALANLAQFGFGGGGCVAPGAVPAEGAGAFD